MIGYEFRVMAHPHAWTGTFVDTSLPVVVSQSLDILLKKARCQLTDMYINVPFKYRVKPKEVEPKEREVYCLNKALPHSVLYDEYKKGLLEDL